MLRHSVVLLVAITDTSVPRNLVHPTDMAFYFPRFQPGTHLASMGIPELSEALTHLSAHTAAAPSPRSGGNTAEAALATPPAPPRWTTLAPSRMQQESPEDFSRHMKHRDKGLVLLERGAEILQNIGALTNPTLAATLRAIYAARFELLAGVEHLPRSDCATHLHLSKTILQQSSLLLYHSDAWDRTDVQQVDTACVIMAHFIKAFCALHTRPFYETPPPSSAAAAAPAAAAATSAKATVKKSSSLSSKRGPSAASDADGPPAGASATVPNCSSTARAAACPSPPRLPKDWSVEIPGTDGGRLTLPMVHAQLKELQRLAAKAYEVHGGQHPDLRWSVPKLQMLEALLTIPLTGHLAHAQQHLRAASATVNQMTRRKALILEGLQDRVHEPELGLYLLAEAEMAARVYDWASEPGEVDAAVLRGFEEAAAFYAEPFVTALDADGVMSVKDPHLHEFEVLAYAVCLTSMATFLLNARRPKATSTRDVPVFMPKQTFNLNPLWNVETSSDVIFTDVQEPTPMSITACRKRTGEALERALQLNRQLLPHQKQNPLACWTLLAMACMYADTREYLYATGIMETVHKGMVHNYGAVSAEHVLMQRLRYEFLAGVGSEDEAKTASHDVVGLLRRMDQLPVQS